MKNNKWLIILFLIMGVLLSSLKETSAFEFSGYIETDGRVFTNNPLYSNLKEESFSISIKPEFYHEWENGSSFTFVPFLRYDSADSERSNFDVEEALFLYIEEDQSFELRMGMGVVFWGVTESQHLVDIINQINLAEFPDGEDKLGQPMVNIALLRDWGTLDFFILPYFRERIFPGLHTPLRFDPVIEMDQARYESNDEERHVDYALRYSNSIGNWDFGIYHFYGTNREPTFLLEFDSMSRPYLVPYYELIHQTGIDVQLTLNSWLWKWESIYRVGQGEEDFFAYTAGFEYTLYGVFETGMDIGLVAEYMYDDRDNEATTPFNNDVMLGTRIACNDVSSTQALLGVIKDVEDSSTVFTVNASRRFGNNWKMELDAYIFHDTSENDYIYSARNGDFVQVSMFWYF
ncbi:hypothetical protein ACFL1T_02465 [Chlamydiota bacterium]